MDKIFGKATDPRPKSPRHYIVEIEKGVPTKGDDSSIASLRDHPGFVALMNRLKLRKAYLRSQLINNRHESMRDVDILQLGSFWLGYLESEVNNAVSNLKKQVPPVVAVDAVEQEFERAQAAIESIGNGKDL
jgi:hypothetical protein